MSVGQEFWMVATGCSSTSEKSREGILQQLQNNDVCKKAAVFPFDVPDGEKALQFGSFDHLIRLTEELQKSDSQIEAIVHRLERQSIELEPTTQFLVTSQRQEKPFLQYMHDWAWDEAKYPRSRSISDNMTLLMKAVNQFDDEARSKTQAYNDLKTQKGSVAKKDQALISAKDLIDVFVPEILLQGGHGASPSNDFVYSEYLDTVVVILPKGADIEFKKTYERMTEHVVPASAKHFKTLDDKDGNMLWRVVVFKSAADNFKKAIREKRWLVRDFVYSSEAHDKLTQQRDEIDKKLDMAHQMIKGLYKAAWSDTMVAWMHVKAARVFVESVLRFGMAGAGKAPTILSFVVSPPASKGQQVRKAIDGILGTGGSAGVGAGEDDEEFFSYVSLSMVPFVVQR